MGLKSNSNHFKGTNGARKGPLLKLNIQLFAALPNNEDQLAHILANRKGHLSDTPEHRKSLVNLTKDDTAFLGKDKRGNDWYAKTVGTKQLWAVVRNGIIQNGGLNDSPVKFIPGEGLKVKFIKRRK